MWGQWGQPKIRLSEYNFQSRGISAQYAELLALTQAFSCREDKAITIYTDSSPCPWESGLLTSTEKEIKIERKF